MFADHEYTLDKLKIYFESFMVDTMIYCNNTILPAHNLIKIKCQIYVEINIGILIRLPRSQVLCDVVLCVCVTYTGFDLTGYDWLYSWFHDGCVTTAGEVYSSRVPIHTIGFPECLFCLECDIYSRLVMFLD